MSDDLVARLPERVRVRERKLINEGVCANRKIKFVLLSQLGYVTDYRVAGHGTGRCLPVYLDDTVAAVIDETKSLRRWRSIEGIRSRSVLILLQIVPAVAVRVRVRVNPKMPEVLKLPPIRQSAAVAVNPRARPKEQCVRSIQNRHRRWCPILALRADDRSFGSPRHVGQRHSRQDFVNNIRHGAMHDEVCIAVCHARDFQPQCVARIIVRVQRPIHRAVSVIAIDTVEGRKAARRKHSA